MYQDIKDEFFAFVYPKECEKERDFYEQKMLNEFNEVIQTMQDVINGKNIRVRCVSPT